MKIDESKFISLIRELENLRLHESFPSGINLFEATGMVRQEIKHSNFLAFLLDPQQPHKFSDNFIKSFLVKVADNNRDNISNLSQLSTVLNDYKDLIVKREWRNTDTEKNKLRIDIVAYSKNNKSVFVIENKVDSREGDNQLVNYVKAVEDYRDFKNYELHFIYLTRNGHEASISPWMSISYEDVLQLIDGLIKKSKDPDSEIQILLKHYSQLIRRNIVQDVKLISECQRIYSQYKDVLDIIYNNSSSSSSLFVVASESFANKHSEEIHQILKKPKRYVFLEKRLFKLVKSFDLAAFFGQDKPILLWFEHRDDNALGLVFEVGPVKDASVDRSMLVSDFQKLFKSTRQFKDRYTRVWTKFIKLQEDCTEQDILVTMDELWEEFYRKIPNVIEVLKKHEGICNSN